MHFFLSSILFLKLFLSKFYPKFQPPGSYDLGSFMRVSTVVKENFSRTSSYYSHLAFFKSQYLTHEPFGRHCMSAVVFHYSLQRQKHVFQIIIAGYVIGRSEKGIIHVHQKTYRNTCMILFTLSGPVVPDVYRIYKISVALSLQQATGWTCLMPSCQATSLSGSRLTWCCSMKQIDRRYV